MPSTTNGGTLWQRLFRGTVHLRQQPDCPILADGDDAHRIMDLTITDRFHAKQSRSTARHVLQTPKREVSVYLKRHYHLPRWRGVLATIFPRMGWSPGIHEWQHLEWAKAEGFPVPGAVAAAEYIGPWGRLQSFLAVEELTGMLPLHEAIPAAAATLPPATFARWKRALATELARLARGLHDRRYFHKDLYLCHFFIRVEDTRALPTSWAGRVHMIDLHRLKRHPWSWLIWQAKDLAQLLYSSDVSGVTPRDRLHFWRVYLGRQPARFVTALLRRLILFKYQR
jgi:hypothetical protein